MSHSCTEFSLFVVTSDVRLIPNSACNCFLIPQKNVPIWKRISVRSSSPTAKNLHCNCRNIHLSINKHQWGQEPPCRRKNASHTSVTSDLWAFLTHCTHHKGQISHSLTRMGFFGFLNSFDREIHLSSYVLRGKHTNAN